MPVIQINSKGIMHVQGEHKSVLIKSCLFTNGTITSKGGKWYNVIDKNNQIYLVHENQLTFTI